MILTSVTSPLTPKCFFRRPSSTYFGRFFTHRRELGSVCGEESSNGGGACVSPLMVNYIYLLAQLSFLRRRNRRCCLSGLIAGCVNVLISATILGNIMLSSSLSHETKSVSLTMFRGFLSNTSPASSQLTQQLESLLTARVVPPFSTRSFSSDASGAGDSGSPSSSGQDERDVRSNNGQLKAGGSRKRGLKVPGVILAGTCL